MALNASGIISLGGSTFGQSTNLEVGLGATASVSLDYSSVRGLAGIATGVISMNDLRGKTFVPMNKHPNPTDLYAWCNGVGSPGCTYSMDPVSSPVGNTPLKMVVTGYDPYIGTYNSPAWNLTPAYAGETWTYSVYVKADRTTYCELFLFGTGAAGNYQELNCDTTAGTFTVYTYWTRIQLTYTFYGSAVRFLQVRLDGGNDSPIGTVFWFDGIQLEKRVLATPFIPTTM